MTTKFKDRPLQWGIIGCGSISYDFCIALQTLPQEKHCLEHVAARDAGRAAEFAGKFSIKKSCGDYKKVFEDPNVDVVYIGTINLTHKDLSILALSHRKPVLCEKSVTMNSIELDEVLACAKKHEIFFMEALWMRCFPLHREVSSKVDSGLYGEPSVLLATFGVKGLFDVPSISSPELGGSMMRNVGLYLINIADLVFRDHVLKEIKACGHINEKTGIDRLVGITMTYKGNKMAQLMVSGDYNLQNECVILCSKGKVTIASPFLCSEKYIENINCGRTVEHSFPLPNTELETNFINSTGLRYEADHVRDCLIEGKLESPLVSHETSKRIMGYLDDILQQLAM